MPFADPNQRAAYEKARYKRDRKKRIALVQKDYRATYSTKEGRAKLLAAKIRCRVKVKHEAVQHYGGKCALCPENELLVLTIDHEQGNGASHRRETKMGTGNHAYHWLRRNKHPKGFRVLCFNCQIRERHRTGCHGGRKSTRPFGKAYLARFK